MIFPKIIKEYVLAIVGRDITKKIMFVTLAFPIAYLALVIQIAYNVWKIIFYFMILAIQRVRMGLLTTSMDKYALHVTLIVKHVLEYKSIIA